MPQSLQCPHCGGAVSVADDAAGMRVKCPHCEKAFLAPGIASTTNDDDDWLSLDEPSTPPPQKNLGFPDGPVPESPATKSVPGKPIKNKPSAGAPATGSKGREKSPVHDSRNAPTPSGKSKPPALSADEEMLLAEFTSELDEFTAEIETPPPPHPGSSIAGGADGLPPFDAGKPPTTPKPKPVTSAVEYASEYRVKCNICGTFVYAKASQAGKTVKCSDCHSPITIPPPPRVKKKQVIDLDKAETFSLEQVQTVERGPDPFKKSAQELLDEASQRQETNPDPTFDDTPSVKEWLRNVFGIFKDIGVVAHWIGLSVFASVPTVIALKIDNPMLIMGLFPAGFFLGVLTVSCGFAILYAVANDEESVSEWPTVDPFGWLAQLFLVVVAASVVAVPLWAISTFVVGPSMLSVAITMFAVYVFFPFVLLSMLDMNSAFVPFSPEVARSVSKCEEAWGGFYFSSGLLFVALFLTFVTSISTSPVSGSVVSIFAGIAATFIYFAMIGRLAYAIGQAVNAPPMKNETDSSEPSDGT